VREEKYEKRSALEEVDTVWKKTTCRSPLSIVKRVQVTLAQTARHCSAGGLCYAKLHPNNTRTPWHRGTNIV